MTGHTLSVVLSAATVTRTVVTKFETYYNRKRYPIRLTSNSGTVPIVAIDKKNTLPCSAEAFLWKCFRKRLMIVMKTLYDSN